MSKIALSPNASGTGVFTIAAPNSNTDRTLTLPDEAGTVLTSASPVITQSGVPAFSAYRATSTQSISAGTYTKVQFNAESYDTSDAYDSVTNFRFMPTVAGYYMINANAVVNPSSGTTSETIGAIFKNGIEHKFNRGEATANVFSAPVSGLVYLNGSTDYIEYYIYTVVAMTLQVSATRNYFEGVLVRAA